VSAPRASPGAPVIGSAVGFGALVGAATTAVGEVCIVGAGTVGFELGAEVGALIGALVALAGRGWRPAAGGVSGWPAQAVSAIAPRSSSVSRRGGLSVSIVAPLSVIAIVHLRRVLYHSRE
jgi:hypothetical protein